MRSPASAGAARRGLPEERRGWYLLVGAGVAALVFFQMLPSSSSAPAPTASSQIQPDAFTGDTMDYAIVIDAGSSGSRVHAFQFKRKGSKHELEMEYFKQLKPGLSSYGDDAKSAAESLRPLLEYAAESVPSERHSETPIIVRATAGLRMLPGEQSSQILNAVAQYLTKYNFKLQGAESDVKIMDGEDEGTYAWLAVNFLLHKVGKSADHTATTVDLGGGSTQVAYATTKSATTAELKLAGQTYHIFTHSFLGYGLNTARKQVARGSAVGNCLATAESSPDLDACRSAVENFIQKGFTIPTPKDMTSPGKQRLPIFVLSFVYDVANELSLLRQPLQDGDPSMILLHDFLEAAESMCSKKLPELEQIHQDRPSFSSRNKDEMPLVCFDLLYIFQLLQQGYGRDQFEVMHAGKAIKMNGNPIETQWPLGAGLLLV